MLFLLISFIATDSLLVAFANTIYQESKSRDMGAT